MIASFYFVHRVLPLLLVAAVKALEIESEWLKIDDNVLKWVTQKLIRHVLILTNSSSSGTCERKSRTSLLVTAWGRIIRLENLMMPQASKSTRIGIKCSTSITANRSKAARQLSSGTEKLKVLRVKKWRMNNLRNRMLIFLRYFFTLSPKDARKPIVFWTVCETSCIACSLSLIVFFSSSFLSSSSSSSLPRSNSSCIVGTELPVIHRTNQFLW